MIRIRWLVFLHRAFHGASFEKKSRFSLLSSGGDISEIRKVAKLLVHSVNTVALYFSFYINTKLKGIKKRQRQESKYKRIALFNYWCGKYAIYGSTTIGRKTLSRNSPKPLSPSPSLCSLCVWVSPVYRRACGRWKKLGLCRKREEIYISTNCFSTNCRLPRWTW